MKHYENGTYTVKLQLADKAGNETEKEWTFKVADVARKLILWSITLTY